jgi:hypothetical protein
VSTNERFRRACATRSSGALAAIAARRIREKSSKLSESVEMVAASPFATNPNRGAYAARIILQYSTFIVTAAPAMIEAKVMIDPSASVEKPVMP